MNAILAALCLFTVTLFGICIALHLKWKRERRESGETTRAM